MFRRHSVICNRAVFHVTACLDNGAPDVISVVQREPSTSRTAAVPASVLNELIM